MIVDGRKIARQLLLEMSAEVQTLPYQPRLTVFTCAPNFETKKFLALKEKYAIAVGIAVTVVELPPAVTRTAVATAVREVLPTTDGIIIQFPFPHIATSDLLTLIPPSHDVDVMQYSGWINDPLPPVVGAIATISTEHTVDWKDKSVVVVGNGRLVGQPVAQYAATMGGIVTILTKESFDPTALALADIIVLGAGVPQLLRPGMVKSGVIVFDAGTSEEGGQLVGDADPAIAETATLFTPVPGGIGPLAVAILLKNVLYFAKKARISNNNMV